MLICRCGGRGAWDAPTDETRCVDCGAVLAQTSTGAGLAAIGSVMFGPTDAIAYMPVDRVHLVTPTRSFPLTSIDLDDTEVRLALTVNAPVCASCRHYGHTQHPTDACMTAPQCLMEDGIPGIIDAKHAALWSCRLHQPIR